MSDHLHRMLHNFTSASLPAIPAEFPFPFHYIPDALAQIAVDEVKTHHLPKLEKVHNFGLKSHTSGLGKMIGILVVKNHQGNLGYLMAFSGKLDAGNIVDGWVPPVFDTLDPHTFYIHEEKEITKINQEALALESSLDYVTLIQKLGQAKKEFEADIQLIKSYQKTNRERRKQMRLSGVLSRETIDQLNNESIHEHYILKDKKKHWLRHITQLEEVLKPMQNTLDTLKIERKERSIKLQNRLFESYAFLNSYGTKKNLTDIFVRSRKILPPSGSGECTAPKLLQYAYQHELHPITMAEFWWGKSPDSEIRVHNHFYPACTGKCKPILGHMLEGITVAADPLKIEDDRISLEILWEDQHILAINKPANFLTVPGKDTQQSILTFMKKRYPHASGPLIVHRLDMSTSGILLIAKTKEVHQHLQNQFSKRKVHKMYTAVLDAPPPKASGEIDLPLRVDIDNRPKQIVCYNHGKPATTRFALDQLDASATRIHLYPITGRTHQLRVHCADRRGLGVSIKGDDLYGTVSDRLYLHATEITFVHPITLTTIHLRSDPPF